jgi:hypothetical protein
MKWFLLVSFVASTVFAQNVEVNKIENANIICSGKNETTMVFINTAAGKVWLKEAQASLSKGVEVEGTIFSGVYSSDKYAGEILGEINFKNCPLYVTLILRKVKNKAELEVQLYSKKDQNSYSKFFLNECVLK